MSTQNKFVSISLGEQLDLDCSIESFPRAKSYWSKQAPPATLAMAATNKHPLRSSLPAGVALHHRSRLFMQSWPPKLTSLGATNVSSSTILAPPRSSATANLSQRYLDLTGRERRSLELDASGQANKNLDKHRTMTTTNDIEASYFAAQRQNEQYHHHTNQLVNDVISASVNSGQEVGDNEVDDDALEANGDNASNGNQENNASSATNTKQTFTLKQTPINPYTYNSRLTIAQMRPNDFGEYICHANNVLGSSETRVIVTSK